MFFLITSIILTIAAFVTLGHNVTTTEHKDKWGDIQTDEVHTWKLNRKQLLSLLCLLICIFGFFTRIPANTVGIVYSPFGGTQEETLTEGIHSKNIFDKVYDISTEVQTVTIKGLTTQTKDAQYLTSDLDVKFRVNTNDAYLVFKQYRTLDKMTDTLIIPTTQRTLELVTTRYNVIDILGEKRAEVYSELEKALKEEFAKYGVEFYSISITDMDAGEALEKAISDEAVAKKAVETAEQNLLKVETEAKAKSVKAKADQEAAKIQADTKIIQAKAEQEANKLLNQSMSEEILSKAWIDKWDGKMPTYYGGDADLMFNMGGDITSGAKE